VGNGYEDATYIFGHLVGSRWQRCCWRAAALQRTIVQHGRRDGRDGLLQGCAEQEQHAASRQCPSLLLIKLLAERRDSIKRRPSPTKDAAITFGASDWLSGRSAFGILSAA
jgi:hypothetical protein